MYFGGTKTSVGIGQKVGLGSVLEVKLTLEEERSVLLQVAKAHSSNHTSEQPVSVSPCGPSDLCLLKHVQSDVPNRQPI